MIPVYWHQHQLFAVKPLVERIPRGLKLGFLISPSVDGEIGVNMVERIGAHELILTAQIFDHGARLRSMELVAQAWGLAVEEAAA